MVYIYIYMYMFHPTSLQCILQKQQMLQYLDGWAQRLNLDTSLEHCLRWSPKTSCEMIISSRSFWGQTLHNRCHKDDIGNHKSQQSKHVPLKSQHKRSTWTMSPDLLEAMFCLCQATWWCSPVKCPHYELSEHCLNPSRNWGRLYPPQYGITCRG